MIFVLKMGHNDTGQSNAMRNKNITRRRIDLGSHAEIFVKILLPKRLVFYQNIHEIHGS